MQGKTTGQIRSGMAGAALTVLLGVLVALTPLGDRLTELSFDLPSGWRAPDAPDGVLILFMDENSAATLEQSFSDSGLWNRALHVQLLERLAPFHPKAVVFDVLFKTPTTNDAALVHAIRQATNAGVPVVIGAKVEMIQQPGQIAGGQLQEPLEVFQHAAHWGVAEGGEIGATLRQHSRGSHEHASLAWVAAQAVGTVALPSPDGERWTRYYGPAQTLPSVSFRDAIEAKPELIASVSNKVCFVGGKPGTPPAAGQRVDEWGSPFGGRLSGVEVTATVYLNLTRGDWLRLVPAPVTWLMLLLGGALLGFWLAWLRPAMAAATALAAALGIAGAACWLMWRQQVWLPWMLTAGVQIPVAVGWSILANFKRLTRDRERLEAELAAAQAENAISTDPALPTSVLSPTAGAAPATPAVPDHTLVRRIGKGAYGEVWLACNAIGTFHAVKIVRREDFEEAAPFDREFRGLQKFMPISRSHPGFVQILHVGRNDIAGFFYYVMETADDERTGQQIDPETYTPRNLSRDVKRRGRLAAAECLQLGLDLCAALDYLHQQHLIHRDIKPANIIFVQGAPKFADIGLVTDIAATGRGVSYLGTEGYIPPEGPGTPSADVFSLGKVLYVASMGLNAASFPELPDTILDWPDAAALFQFNQILLQACHEEVAVRFSSAAQLRASLLELQSRWQ